jgi:hypothetical protein
MTDMSHCAQLLIEMGVSITVCLGWSQTMILPISASQVAGITGMSHHDPLNSPSLKPAMSGQVFLTPATLWFSVSCLHLPYALISSLVSKLQTSFPFAMEAAIVSSS